MGATCVKGVGADGELALDPTGQVTASDLKKSKLEELMQIAGAQVFIIDSSGEEAPVVSGTFRLMKVVGPKDLAVCFVGEKFEELSKDGFYYPLLPDTPIYLSPGNVLTMTAGEGDVFGIRLPKPFPGGEAEKQALIELIALHCNLEVGTDPDVADKIAGYITKGGRKVVNGVELAAGFMSKGIAASGVKARQKVGQKEAETEVSEVAKVSVASAAFITGSTVAVAAAVTDGLLDTALMLGEEASKAVRGSPENKTPKKDNSVVKVGKAAGVAGLQVFEGLVNAGDRLLDQTCEETAVTVGHRYGKDAGDVTRDGLQVGRDVKQLNDMVGKKAVKRLAQKGAMYTAKGMIAGQPVKEASSQHLISSPASSSGNK